MKIKPLLTYFILAYFISWLIWLPLYGHIFGLRSLPLLPFQHALGGLGPLIAAFLTAGIYNKPGGTRQLLAKCFQFRPIIYLLIALLAPFLLAIIAMLINYIISSKTSINLNALLTSKEFPQFSLLTFFVYNLIFFGFGEEVGWRGFALPHLQKKFSALTASIVLTLLWAFWHWPLFFYRPGYTSMDMAGIIGWVLSLLTGSVLLTWLYNSSKGSLLICAIFHATIDIAFNADFASRDVVNYMGFLITIWGILTIIFFKWKNLSGRQRVQDI